MRNVLCLVSFCVYRFLRGQAQLPYNVLMAIVLAIIQELLFAPPGHHHQQMDAQRGDQSLQRGLEGSRKPACHSLEGPTKLVHLIRTYFKMDGHHIQFNVVNAETLRKAQKNPEQYQDLIVRVAGYSDYFVDLGVDLQNEIIERTEHLKY